jgi:peptide/nickel transport system permease protein
MLMRGRDARRLCVPVALVGAIVLIALLAPVLPLPDPVRMEIVARLAPPSISHPLGQDEYGRDVLARLIWGGRVSVAVAVVAAALAAGAGIVLGLLGGFFRGLVELITVRPVEAILCLPPILLALLAVTLVGPGVGTLIVVLAILYAPGFTRVAYAQTLATRALDYVTAQTALGAAPARILGRTILPNVAPALIVQFSLTVASAMVLESGLSFLGLGVVPPDPSWGLMIRGARSTMDHAPWLLIWPCAALTGTVLALNVLCDTLGDALDPRAGVLRGGFLRRTAATTFAFFPETEQPALLKVDDLSLEIATSRGASIPVRGVSFALAPGETLALVGESGSGKTLTALAILGLLPPEVGVTSGAIWLRTRHGSVHNLLALRERDLQALRGNEIAMVFQDPGSSLNPIHQVGQQVVESIAAHGQVSASEARARSVHVLERVGLPDAQGRFRAYPHELSGGQRQRVMIASAIANHPRLLVADEPTTALDVTIQAQILDLFAELKRQEFGMGVIFITHNLAMVADFADRVCVMYAGLIIEEGKPAEVFTRPRHPYTSALLASVPEAEAEALASIPGTVPQPHDLPKGCPFAPRCAHVLPQCLADLPLQQDAGANHRTRCIRWREVT